MVLRSFGCLIAVPCLLRAPVTWTSPAQVVHMVAMVDFRRTDYRTRASVLRIALQLSSAPVPSIGIPAVLSIRGAHSHSLTLVHGQNLCQRSCSLLSRRGNRNSSPQPALCDSSVDTLFDLHSGSLSKGPAAEVVHGCILGVIASFVGSARH